MWKLLENDTWILLSRRRRLVGFIDHWPFTGVYIAVVGSLESVEQMS